MRAILRARFQPFNSFSRAIAFRDFVVSFEPHQPIVVVSGCKAVVLFSFMLEYAFVQIAGNSDVQSVAAAGHDVTEIRALMHGCMLRGIKSARSDKQPQILPLPLRSAQCQRQDDSALKEVD
jgi:hypothetical protein